MGFVSSVVDSVSNAVSDVVDGAVNLVKDVGSSIDDAVHNIIPGGWAGVGALGLMAVGIYDPTLLGLAEEGTLTTEALTSAGVDAQATATAVANTTPQVLSATQAAVSSGVSPQMIAMANATTDPIAALAAAQGSTIVDTAYLTSIGAPEALVTTAAANNAALAAQSAGGYAGPGIGEGTSPAVTTTPTTTTPEYTGPGIGEGASPPAAQPVTQTFDDGSTLTTHPDGSISATDTAGKATDTLVSPGSPGQAPVYDAAPGTPGVGAGTPDPSLLDATKGLVSGIYNNLGPLGTAALGLGGAALASNLLTPGGSNLGGSVGSGSVSYPWGTATPLQNGPLNAGLLQQAASTPYYHSANPTDAQYYWGAHNVVNTPEDIANYNNLPNAPVAPFGAGKTAVGGQATLNVPNFVNQYITNPAYYGVNNATAPGYTPSMAEQALAATTGPAVPA